MQKKANTAAKKKSKKYAAPTPEQYGNLQAAYTYFNDTLFNGELSACLLTFGRDVKKCYGYFHANQWANKDDNDITVHTISLTPMHLCRPLRDVFGTLVHEMVHLWQEDHGQKKSRTGYHNREWAEKMKEVGLYPSSTGEEGGKETGQKCSHYILDGGAYDQAFKKLPDAIGLAWLGVQAPTKLKKKDKVKYQCPGCDAKVWGKPEMSIRCEECNESFETLD